MAGGLMLGPVVFHAFEVPERIRFGGIQRLAVHAMPGGGRVVDVMGPEEGPIAWSGVCSGWDAAARVRMLEGLRRDGAVLALSWEGWRFSVIIDSFQAEAVNPAWIPYKLRLCVVAAGDVDGDDAVLPVARLEDALALGAGPDLEARIGGASAGLGAGDLGEVIAAAGSLARLVTARALAGAALRGGS